MHAPIWNALLTSAALVFGVYQIGYGFYAWRLSGFRFYAAAGLLTGSPFLVIGVILFLQPRPVPPLLEWLPALVWAFGEVWKAWRKRIAKRDHPREWAKWEAVLRSS